MDEEQWLACTDPTPMLVVLGDSGRASERKLRLFGCACARVVWHLLGVRPNRKAVLVAERYADGLDTARALEKARRDAYYAPREEWNAATHAAQHTASSLLSP